MRKQFIINLISVIVLMFIVLIPESCSVSSGQHFLGSNQLGGVLQDIQQRGKLVALTDNNPINYFVYKGEPRGYQYEMLKHFADDLNVKLEIIVEPDYHKAIQYLQQGKVDIIAMDMPPLTNRRFAVEQTQPLFMSKQVLVQHLPANWRKLRNSSSVDALMVRDLSALSGQTVNISDLSRKQYYLSELQHATAQQVLIETTPGVNAPDLIRKVENGEIAYTIAFESTARALSLVYHDIDASTPVSPEMGVSWTLRKGSVNLMNAINTWIDEHHGKHEFESVYARYYLNPRYIHLALGKPQHQGSISDYDEIIRQLSRETGYDWRFIAALIYKESKFDINARSHRGAFGLMQLMPNTAQRFGASESSTPREQIAAGIRLIKYLDNVFKARVPDTRERQKFILAAYNIGLAHVLDAIKLAEKHDRNPAVWNDNVEYCLLSKSNPEFYNDPVVKYGRVSGKETQRFVTDVLERYDHYKMIVRD